MKKIILLAMSVFTIAASAQENKSWRLGLSSGSNSNHAKFSGGMSDANARFNQNPFGTSAVDFIVRYDYNNHWMAMSSLGVTSTGYEFSLSENYSLLNRSRQFSTISSDFTKLEMPTMVFYKFNPNCTNSRWLIGAGIVPTYIEGKTIDRNYQTNEGSTNYLTSTATSKGGSYVLLRWSVAREKIFKSGAILNAAFIVNVGFTEMTNATVKYTVDNQSYEHDFSSKGTYAGFRVSYFLRPLGSKVKGK